MRRRKPNRSRRIVKKLLKRHEGFHPDWNMSFWMVDGGRRLVSAQEVVEFGLEGMVS